MTDLLTAAQMRAIEREAMASGEVTGLELMERAGRGVVEAVFEEWPELSSTSQCAVVLCGPGNNGGDGFVVARLLKDRGWDVEVFLYGDPDKLPPDAMTNCQRWLEIGEAACSCDWTEEGADERDWAHEASRVGPDIVIDALFGIGLSRPIKGNLQYLVGRLGEKRMYHQRIVAIDVPSGLCADSGRYLDDRGCREDINDSYIMGGLAGIAANLTVTFHRPKIGHYIADGSWGCGRLIVKDIGL
ncbi:MAG: NAD(P)H-hydrate epimerase [Pseudomonadota bacterium]